MSCDCEIDVGAGDQQGVLITLLAINGVMFVLEIAIEIFAESTALINDCLQIRPAIIAGLSV